MVQIYRFSPNRTATLVTIVLLGHECGLGVGGEFGYQRLESGGAGYRGQIRGWVVKSDVYRSNEGQAEGPAWLTKQVLINSWQLKDVAVCSGPAWSQPCRCGLIVVCVMAAFGLHDEGAKVPGDLGAVLLHSAEVRPRGGAFPLEGIWPKLPRGCRRRDRGRSRHGARSRCRTCT